MFHAKHKGYLLEFMAQFDSQFYMHTQWKSDICEDQSSMSTMEIYSQIDAIIYTFHIFIATTATFIHIHLKIHILLLINIYWLMTYK